MFSGHATPAATRDYASTFPIYKAAGFFRLAQQLTVSSLGIGTYLGPLDDATDAAYKQAIHRALSSGINLIDTSLNYRHQRSETAAGEALAAWVHEDGGSRERVVLSTKAGYLVPGALPAGVLRADDVVGGMHSLAPAFLSDQIARSRRNLGVETIDLFYLHNPETQLKYIDPDTFYARVRRGFELLEGLAVTGEICFYGAATWDGFRTGSGPQALSLLGMHELARQVGGDAHHFRFIQLPFNLAMQEAISTPLEDGRTVLEIAADLGITVICSASLLQSRLARGLPDEVAKVMPGLETDAQRALQFARSAPGVAVALAGMSRAEHVRENLGIAPVPPVAPDAFLQALL